MNLIRQDRRRTPAIYAIFMLGYVVLSFLLVEQNRTIVAQHTLIRSLYEDSHMLTTLQIKRIAENHQRPPQNPER
jgi:hypothetical protein